ncbi:hypothetical protein SADUNF_Sadunf11G0026800 [Salix dunnii]|uniref:Uncharacterized protein n=1 Tax=Salix dunnii TaxID=1413687 RepID=A0A835JL68_9ROSI|nr:hypothetical protein SADUNF_Sadunf11G0026800 [Salix dunnii]
MNKHYQTGNLNKLGNYGDCVESGTFFCAYNVLCRLPYGYETHTSQGGPLFWISVNPNGVDSAKNVEDKLCFVGTERQPIWECVVRCFGCVNSDGKKQCRTLYWRLKAAVKRAVKKKGGKRRLKFQYDPSSYALNFDDGGCNLGATEYAIKHCNTLQESCLILWIYVVWVEEP